MEDYWKNNIKIEIRKPLKAPATKLTQEDVWGKFKESQFDGDKYTPTRRVSKGMVVASSEEKCPVWHDKVPYKAVTVVCKKSQVSDVTYWLEFVHGGDSVTKYKELPRGKVAMRSEYQCW